MKSNTKRKYIHSYWPELDTLCHEHGVGSGTVSRHIKQFVKQFEKFVKSIEGTKTTIIITADHGLIDVGTRQRIEVKKHTGFAQTLTLPMSGEARAEYCYVRPDKVRDFEAYVQRHFAHVCTMYRSEDIIRQGLFGLGTPHEKLKDRIGDYVLVMKENYIIKDFVLGEEEKFRKAYHGGVSKEEMFVPLVVIKTE